jgi:adenylate kinase family enzyme
VETLLLAFKEEGQDLMGDEYDPKKVRREIYADRDLAKAIRSGHEIMLKSTTGLYIDDEFYEESVLPLLQGTGPRLESFDQTDSVAVTEGVSDPDIFKAVFVIGGPGSGKTSISQKLLGHTGLRRVDVDSFFTMLKSKADVAGHYETEFYKQAGALAGRRQDLFLKGRLGMVFDSTGRKTQRILSTKTQLESLGYDTLLIYVKTDIRTALSRNELRPRKVDPQEVEKIHQEVQQNIQNLTQAFGKNVVVVDNTLVPDLNRAAENVDAFLRKAPQQPEAIKWLKSQDKY